MRRRGLLALAAAAVPAIAAAQHRLAGVSIPPENDWRGDRPARPPIGDAEDRAGQLFDAILQNDAELARPFFFPQEPFRILKGIADPDRYWNVLWRHYVRDIDALHGEVPAGATFERLQMTRRGGWVERREEANALPYWASRHDWVHYRVSRWMRNSEPPTARASARKCGLISSRMGAKARMKASAGSFTDAS